MGVRLFSPRNALEANLPAPAGQDRPKGQQFHGRLLEAGALLLFFAAAFLALSLASYRVDPFDPTQGGSNLAGATGAAIAAVLVQGFGVVAWLLPLDLALLVPGSACRAPERPGKERAEDERAIRELVREGARRFDAHDADAWLEPFADDAWLVNVRGRRWNLPGDREAVRAAFATALREATMEPLAIEVRFPRPDVALVHVEMRVGPFVDAAGGGRPAELQRSLSVLTKERGRWTVRAFHNTTVAEPPPPRD